MGKNKKSRLTAEKIALAALILETVKWLIDHLLGG
jgi:hypothetical protein